MFKLELELFWEEWVLNWSFVSYLGGLDYRDVIGSFLF